VKRICGPRVLCGFLNPEDRVSIFSAVALLFFATFIPLQAIGRSWYFSLSIFHEAGAGRSRIRRRWDYARNHGTGPLEAMLYPFLNIPPIYLIYFFYGGAFLLLGISIAVKEMRGSDLKLASRLPLLVLFGFTHGIHEWLQLYPLIEGSHLTIQEIFQIKLAASVLFVLSFLFLLFFGLSLLRIVAPERTWLFRTTPFIVFTLWFLFLWHQGFSMDLRFARYASIGARHTFGLFGGFLTAYGLIRYSHEIKHLSQKAARNLSGAGISFGMYAVFAGVFSSDITYRLPFPIELLRGSAAILITFFMVKALNIFDIEMRRKIEHQARRILQAEKLTSLGQLAAGIAHEINNPLTNASLNIQLLKLRLGSRQEEDVLLQKLDAVEKNIDRAAAIARELLLFSRQQEGALTKININTVLRSALTLMEYKLRGIVVREQFGVVPDVTGDPGKLEQVFINVLSNAVEATQNGGRIAIITDFDGRNVRIRIDDSGTGMPEEHLSRVFDPFFTTKEIGAGTGLGLSICYGIIKQHNGTIDLSSILGTGTTVTITIPLGDENEKNSDR
jgi:two-component system NtrC family sensor kinase